MTKIRVYSIVHNLMPALQKKKKKKREGKKKRMYIRTSFGQISSFAFISPYRKLMPRVISAKRFF